MDASPIQRAIVLAGGSEAKLADAIGFTQPAVHKAKKSGRAGPRMALAIHWFSNGEISASEIRPDLWRRAEDVPTPVTEGEGR